MSFSFNFATCNGRTGFWRDPVQGIETIGFRTANALHDAFVKANLVTATWIPRSLPRNSTATFDSTSVPIDDLALVVKRRLSRSHGSWHAVLVYYPKFDADVGLVACGPEQLAAVWDLTQPSSGKPRQLYYSPKISRSFSRVLIAMERSALGVLRPDLVLDREATLAPPAIPPAPVFYAYGTKDGQPVKVQLTGERGHLDGITVEKIVADLTTSFGIEEPLIGRDTGTPTPRVLRTLGITSAHVKDFVTEVWKRCPSVPGQDTLIGGEASEDQRDKLAFAVFRHYPAVVERTGISIREMRNLLAKPGERWPALDRELISLFKQAGGYLVSLASDEEILEALMTPEHVMHVSLAPKPVTWQLLDDPSPYTLSGVLPGFQFDFSELSPKFTQLLADQPSRQSVPTGEVSIS